MSVQALIGRLTFRLTVLEDGRVGNVEIVEGLSQFSYAIKERMKYIFKTLEFPAPGTEVSVDVPFNLVAVHSN